MDYLSRAKAFRTKKRLGQNFLVDSTAIDTIINESDIQAEDEVFEIGSGLGFVTEQIAEKAKKVFAVEIDEDAINKLNQLPYENIEIINQDILKTDLSEFSEKPMKIIANIPYYITSPILVHLLGELGDFENKNRKSVKEIILMVQYEVAKRIVANNNSQNKEYGTLSILCNYWAKTEIIKKVFAKSFFPKPKVDSALVKLTVLDEPSVSPKDPKMLRKTVKASFGKRRKTLKNGLLMGGFDKEKIENAFKKLNIDEKVRGETLSLQEFSDLSDELS